MESATASARDFSGTARICSVMVAAIACLALLGWILSAPVLASFGPGLATMKPNTAVCFIAMAVAQWLLRESSHAISRRRGSVLALASAVAMLGILTMVEYTFRTSFVIDRWLFPGEMPSGRMGFNTSVAFVLSAFSVALLRLDSPRTVTAGQWSALASGWVAVVSFLGYMHSVRSLGSVSSYTEMSIPTTMAFVLVTVGSLCARPDQGLMSLATSPHAGGAALRRLVPAVFAVPFLLGWAVLEGSRAGWYPPGMNLPILAALTMASLTVLVYRIVLPLERYDAERAGTARALERSEAEYRDLFQNVPAAVFQSTPGGRFLNVNRALVQLLGFENGGQVLSLNSTADVGLQIQSPGGDERAAAEKHEVRNLEAELRRSDGGRLTALVNARVVKDENGQPIYLEGTLTDISDRKRLEDQLRQTQKMEAIGRLAGGIAHDFNNMLTAIIGYAQILREELFQKAEFRENADEILHAGRRAASLTRQLLAFSRQQVLEAVVLNLGEVVESLAPMLRRILGEDVELELRLAAVLDRVKADRGQIEQVVMNLVVNARDAMPLGGRIVIEADNVALDGQYAASHAEVKAGRYVLLAVTDTGVGMDESTKAQIFEPFFTTKSQGRGTGLGLATVHGVVKQMGGVIWVYSEPGRGTTFKVYLPRTESEEREAKTLEPEPARATGNEMILIVEDEAPVRTLVCRIMKRAGYTVMEAGDPKEALARAAELGSGIDLVITDIVMPSGSGPDLVSQLRAERPGLPALYISGYANTAIVRNGQLGVDLPFLQKPFSTEALLAKVRQVLDGRA